MYQTGNFEECMEVEAPFPTRYCLATIKAHPSDSRGNFNDRSVLGRFYVSKSRNCLDFPIKRVL